MGPFPKVRHPALWLGAVAVVAAGSAAWLFPRAVPVLTLDQRLTRGAALQRADSFFRVHALAPTAARTAVRFQAHDSLLTYVDLAGGGRDSVAALAAGRDVAPFTWTVRAFVARDPHEAWVDFATDGRVVGFRRVLAEADERPDVGEAAGEALARTVLADWLGEPPTRWRLLTSSYVTRPTSGRVDRTYTFERVDRRIGDAPIRLDLVVAGDTPAGARPYVVVPETFRRRYGEMRSANDLLALVASVGLLGLMVVAVIVLRRYGVAHEVRWRPAFVVGGVIGALFVAAGLNQLPGSWFVYDTATSPGTFRAMVTGSALLTGVAMALLVGLTLAAAEVATRHAFPDHPDWWALWRFRGTREVAGRVAGGYVVAALALAYVALFYLVARNLFGWWVPTELLDDPNLIATPLPWVSGLAISLQAGVWEEALARALPLSLLAIWSRGRPHRTLWMAAGVVGTALIFGFAHSNYPSWPPYSRGIEIFFDACFWAVLFLAFGLLVTVLAHFAYDLVLFGAFAGAGSATPYRITLAVVVLCLAAPALAVAWAWLRQRGLRDLPPEGRFGEWRAHAHVRTVALVGVAARTTLARSARVAALAVGGAAAVLALALPRPDALGRPFTASRAVALATADSVVRARGVDPGAWTRLAAPFTDSLGGWRRFLVTERAESLAVALADDYAPPAWWAVRYVRTTGTAAERAEEWRVRLLPDGTPLDHRHIVPDSAPRPRIAPDQARRVARAAIADAGIDTTTLREADFQATERPARSDVTVTWTDASVPLPGDAVARVWVTLAGDEPLGVRRGVELPETFTRAERDRGTTRLVILLVCAAVFFGLVVTATVWIVRRNAPVLDDGGTSRRRVVLAVVVLTAAGIASALNTLPDVFYRWPTSVPWSTFMGTTAVTIVTAVIPALVVVGLWLVMEALRRRVGVPLFPARDPATRDRRDRDLLLAGVGLGSVAALAGILARLPARAGVPGPHSTLLNQSVPLLGEALAIPLALAFTVVGVGIPALAVAGVSTRPVPRALAAALLALPLLVLALTLAPTGTNLVLLAGALVLAGVGAVWASLRWWATWCAWAWVVGALVYRGLADVRSILHASTAVERGAGAVALGLTAVLIALAVRAGRGAEWAEHSRGEGEGVAEAAGR